MPVYHSVWLKNVRSPGSEAFAVLFTFESLARSLLSAVIPLQALELLGDASDVSSLFFGASFAAIFGAFAVPWLVRRSARRWVYSAGALTLATAAALMATDTLAGQVAGMTARVLGVVTLTICVNLYIMENVPRRDFTRMEPKRMFYSAGAWSVGPFLGVFLRNEVAEWAPYAASATSVLIMLAYFWFLRMKDFSVFGTAAGAATAAPGPLANLRRFAGQPRLALAWSICFARCVWWVVFNIYGPIYAVEAGRGELAGGAISSAGMAFMFLVPIWGMAARRWGMRTVLTYGFSAGAAATLAAAVFAATPWLAAPMLLAGAFAMVAIDAVGYVPFLLSVKPRERAEMTAVFNTHRDFAEMTTPGVLAQLLKVVDLPVVFVLGGVTVLALGVLSRRMHPRLGRIRGGRPPLVPPAAAS